MIRIPLRPHPAAWLRQAHADRARGLRAMADEQRGRVAPGEDAWWREARMRSAAELDARAEEEDWLAARWAF